MLQLVVVIFSAVPALLHLFGLFLLVTTRFCDEDLTQRLYYVMLSLGELIVCVLRISIWLVDDDLNSVQQPLYMVFTFMGWTLVYEVMIAITLDRFFKVFLNIKYPLYWNYAYTVRLAIAFCIVNCVLCSCFWLANVSVDVIKTYYFLPFDFLFLIIAIGTYGYIFTMIKKKAKTHHFELSCTHEHVQTTKEITNCSKESQRRTLLRQNRHFLSTFLLVITFFIFAVVPDLILLHYSLRNNQGFEEWINMTLALSYDTSFLCDFIIYTFSSKPIRRRLKNWFKFDS